MTLFKDAIILLSTITVVLTRMFTCPSNGLCKCGVDNETGNFTAKCDGRKYSEKLYEIPIFPSNTTIVVFERNYLFNLSKPVLLNLTYLHLTDLNLQFNNIRFISRDAFKDLPYLRSLDISGNNMSHEDVSNSLFSLSARITELKLNHLLWHPFKRVMFKGLERSEIRNIELSHSYLSPFKGLWFKGLQNLSSLDVSWNSIKDDLNLTGLSKLSRLDLTGNWINVIPDFCRDGIRNLVCLNLSNTKLYTLIQLQNQSQCLKRLKYINLGGLSLRIIPNNIFSRLPSLQTIRINKMSTQLTKIHPTAFNSSTLQSLTFSRADGFRFSKAMAQQGFFDPDKLFRYCTKLTELDLSHNIIEFSSEKIRDMFTPLKNIKRIKLDSLYLANMPRDFFYRFPLLQFISLKNNMILPWEDGSVFHGLKHLKSLNLRSNQIGMIYPISFPAEILNTLEYLDLTYNVFKCNCNIMWFRKWMDETKILIENKKMYKCDDRKTLVEHYNPTWAECHVLSISMSVGCGVGLLLLITINVYFCRWRIRFHLYKFRSLTQNHQKLSEDKFVYAAYVIYCYEDFTWVKNHLIPKTENEYGFKLCIPHRDFELGKVFADNIVEHMHLSQTVIPVLSNNFAKNEWCLFQLAVARSKLTKQGNLLIFPIMLEEIEFKNMNAALYYLIKMSSYAAWDNDENAQELFYDQVLNHLRK